MQIIRITNNDEGAIGHGDTFLECFDIMKKAKSEYHCASYCVKNGENSYCWLDVAEILGASLFNNWMPDAKRVNDVGLRTGVFNWEIN